MIDGDDSPAFAADVAIVGETIAAIGDLGEWTADTIIDAAGLIVAPGFIDVHTHDDHACIAMPDQTPKISQGVTTLVVGNCGLSVAGLAVDGDPLEPLNLLGGREAFVHPSFAAYADAVVAARPSVNVGALVGHSTLRVATMDDLGRPANAGEIAAMRAILSEALNHGALGLSSGLFYAPSQAADARELVALGRDVAAAGGIYTAHIRDEYDGVADALREAIETAGEAGSPLILSHHKCAGVQNWGRSNETLGLIDMARQQQQVGLDCYPYVAGSTVIRPDLADGRIDVLINWSTPHPEQAGRKLSDIAADWGCDQAAAAERLIPGGASYFQIHEDDMRAILSHPGCMIGSDGLPNDPHPHPRLWGAFPRVLGRYARDLGLFSFEHAVHKMTGLAARTFHLANRGLLRKDFAADVTIFDPATIIDTATYDAPRQVAIGIRHVIVNGTLSWSDGRHLGGRAGQFLKRGGTA